jgi:hypothetical protein
MGRITKKSWDNRHVDFPDFENTAEKTAYATIAASDIACKDKNSLCNRTNCKLEKNGNCTSISDLNKKLRNILSKIAKAKKLCTKKDGKCKKQKKCKNTGDGCTDISDSVVKLRYKLALLTNKTKNDKWCTKKTGGCRKIKSCELVDGTCKRVEKDAASKKPKSGTKKAEKEVNKAEEEKQAEGKKVPNKALTLPLLPNSVIMNIATFTPASLGDLQPALGKNKYSLIKADIKKKQIIFTQSAIKERENDPNHMFKKWWEYVKSDDIDGDSKENKLHTLYISFLQMERIKVNDVKLKKDGLCDMKKRLKKAKKNMDPNDVKNIIQKIHDADSVYR